MNNAVSADFHQEFSTVKVSDTHSDLHVITRRVFYSCDKYRTTLILGAKTIGTFPTDQAKWLAERLNEAFIRIKEKEI